MENMWQEELLYDGMTRHHTNNLECLIADHTLGDGRVDVSTDSNWPRHRPYTAEGDETSDYHSISVIFNGPDLFQRLRDDKVIYRMTTKGKDGKNDEYVRNMDEALSFFSNFHQDGILIYDSVSGAMQRVNNINGGEIDLSTKLPLDFVRSQPPKGYDYGDMNNEIGTRTYLMLYLADKYPGLKGVALKQSRFGRLRLGKVIKIDEHGLNNERFFTYFDKDRPEISVPLDLDRGALDDFQSGYLGVERSYHPTGKGVERDGPDKLFYRKPIEEESRSYAHSPILRVLKPRFA